MEKGIAKGIEIGIAKGVEEVAINMLKFRFPLEQIQLSASLLQAKIEQLAKDNNLL